MGIDVWEVIEAAKTKPFGFQAFYPGPGLGGHCIPIDPFYLTWKAREYGVTTRFIELADEINSTMPAHVVAILELLIAKGARADYSDPHLPALPPGRHHDLRLTSVPLEAATIAHYDALVLITDHSAFDYATIFAHAQLVSDTRNAFAAWGHVGSSVVKA